LISESDGSPFAVDAVRRIENWSDLGNFEEKVIMLAPWRKEYEYLGDPDTKLGDGEERFQMHVHARPAECVYGDADYSFDFDGVIDFEYDELDAKEFVDIEYRTWINVFENEFPEHQLLYPEPEEYL
jgi:hypothetical protein